MPGGGQDGQDGGEGHFGQRGGDQPPPAVQPVGQGTTQGGQEAYGQEAGGGHRPVHAGWSVRAKMRTPRATVCIQVPTLDTRAADQMRAKLRDRRGRRDASATAARLPGPTGEKAWVPARSRAPLVSGS